MKVIGKSVSGEKVRKEPEKECKELRRMQRKLLMKVMLRIQELACTRLFQGGLDEFSCALIGLQRINCLHKASREKMNSSTLQRKGPAQYGKS